MFLALISCTPPPTSELTMLYLIYYHALLFYLKITSILNKFVQKKVLLALEDAGIFTSGGLVKDKVMPNIGTFCICYSFFNV